MGAAERERDGDRQPRRPSGKQVTLKTELTDSHGNSVSQTVVRADDVR